MRDLMGAAGVIAMLLSLPISTSARADEAFDARVQRAKAIEDTPVGSAYQDQMWPLVKPFISRLVEECLAGKEKPDARSFVWLGTLTADGKLVDVEVQPLTDVSACFSHGMDRAPFPKPPKEFEASGLPLTFHMRLHEMN